MEGLGLNHSGLMPADLITLAPLLSFLGYELTKIGGRARKHRARPSRQAASLAWDRRGP
jgi:uncharacterized protein YciW